MAELKQVEIVSTATGNSISYSAEGNPKRTNAGHSMFGEINALGLAWLEPRLQAKGLPPVANNRGWVEFVRTMLRAIFGEEAPENGFGNRGEAWGTPAERALYKVFVDGEEYNPPYATKNEGAAAKTKTSQVKAQWSAIDLNALFQQSAYADEEDDAEDDEE